MKYKNVLLHIRIEIQQKLKKMLIQRTKSNFTNYFMKNDRFIASTY